jgi:hypothetical protein
MFFKTLEKNADSGRAEALELLTTILAELRGMRADLRSNVTHVQHLPTSLSRTDQARLARLLPAIAGALGSEEFTSRDLACHSAPALRLVLRGLSAKSIGRLLARADGVPTIDGWVVERRGVEINVALWRVVAVSHRLESGTGVAQSGAINGRST